MFTKQSLALQLAEGQLTKLTSESEEIRMRALDQIETRFIRCLQLGEPIQFKPVLLLKQLIRWFGYTPPLVPDRVLAMIMELLRSEYAEAVIRKIPYERFKAELEKVRRVLHKQESKRISELLDDINLLLLEKYKIDRVTPSVSSLSSNGIPSQETESADSSSNHIYDNLKPEDYEPAWSYPCLDDVATMKNMIDMPRNGVELQLQLTELIIRMGDYPIEYFLQPPFVFLHLVQLQTRKDGSLLHVNRALIACLRLLQHRVLLRRNTLSYAASFEPPSRPKQLKVGSALVILLDNCMALIRPLLLSCTADNWHIMELIVEIVRTYDVLSSKIPLVSITLISDVVNRLLAYCNSVEGSSMTQLMDSLRIPRLQSLILNGVLHDMVALNINYDKNIDRRQAKALIQPIILDSAYVSCIPERMEALNSLISSLDSGPSPDDQLIKLKRAYSVALNQLQPNTELTGSELIKKHRQVCHVIVQLRSETLVKQLFEAVVQCIPFYAGNKTLRKEADELLYTLIDLPDIKLRSLTYRLMIKCTVAHFHSFMNKTVYMTGCSNVDLVRQHILGVPLTPLMLRRMITQSSEASTSERMRQWCLDYPIMIMKLNAMLAPQDFNVVFPLLLPVLPLLVCRSVTDKILHNVIWDVLEPDSSRLEPQMMLRGYVYFMFHPNGEIRSEATTTIAYVLQCQDQTNRYMSTASNVPVEQITNDLCIIQPAVCYRSIFIECSDERFQGQRSLDALFRLLQTKDIKSNIRKSTMTQLNVLLRNWRACEEFSTKEDGYRLIMESLHNALKKGSDTDILLPTVSILMKLLFHDAEFRLEIANTFGVYILLLRALYLFPHKAQLRQDVSVCLFQMLFQNCITSTEDKLVLNANMEPMILPVNYEIELKVKPTAATEGMELQLNLEETHFGLDRAKAAQHWRLYMAHRVCQVPSSITLESMSSLDIRESLKIKMADLALIRSSNLSEQLGYQFIAAENCSNHEDLQKTVSVIQLYLVVLRNSISSTVAENLWKLINKYIRLAPGNEADEELYKSMLDLCVTCIRFSQQQAMDGLSYALETDHHHSFHLLLNDRQIPLDKLFMICQCMMQLLSNELNDDTMNWYGKIFMQLSTLAKTHFELRQLQHVRCMLCIMRFVSERNLKLSKPQLMSYAQHFIQLSSNLRTSTQTGSEWQRDCLYIICQLQLHVIYLEPKASIKDCIPKDVGASYKVLRYFLTLCGHGDSEVRALSWVSLANWITICASQVAEILPCLDFLPGGLPACCLTTLMDTHEMMLVRELAGRVFILLMPTIGAESSLELLRNHDMLKTAYNALKSIHDTPWMFEQIVGERHSCEVISCYVAICSKMVAMKPEWCATLCGHSFMTGLSDVMKALKSQVSCSIPLVELCASQICELYSMCYANNFEFLQMTICRDSVFLQNYLTLINDVVSLECPEYMAIPLFKMFHIFCMDTNSNSFLIDQIKNMASLFIDFFQFGLHVMLINSPLQRFTLSALSLVFTKAKAAGYNRSMLSELERFELAYSDMPPDKEDIAKDGKQHFESNKEQTVSRYIEIDFSDYSDAFKQTPNNAIQATNAAIIIFHRLDQLFDCYYLPKTSNFLEHPVVGHVQVCEALGGLLKVSSWAVKAAGQTKLLAKVVHILDDFLNDEKIGNAAVYVKRVGPHKAHSIIGNLLVLINMLSQWHSSPTSDIIQTSMATSIAKILIRIWPWLSHSYQLKKDTVQLIMFLTEHSFEMCKQISLLQSGHAQSLLHLMARVADFETTKKEIPNKEPSLNMVPALRVMVNCCCCVEGRQSLSKMNLLDMFDTILPANPGPAHPKVRPPVLIAWLGFWEVFSRYDVGGKACHLQSLINTIRRSPPLSRKRILCLRILRNMCFFNGNRPRLVELADFINLLRDILEQKVQKAPTSEKNALHSFEEHRLAVLMLWKLFGFGAKYKGMLRGTKLFKLLIGLRVEMSVVFSETVNKYTGVHYARDLANLLEKLMESMRQ
ncbi:uncharacterized protein LOC6734130 [Drosophila simulans]|uniref:Rotatin N-terminal domain-containing protein n=1 Tax=Drosophila simulans TaxID=7240 RepID=A0A0J9RAT6_DROSI|nr:uncharacterized protein LOC6734130 [Drosophila simulans]KMY93168.1 uncharacterized protein Dsimw501_GD10861 [Drosophila simulans]